MGFPRHGGLGCSAKKLPPVRLPLGRARLATRPIRAGSAPTRKTTGIVVVAALAANTAASPDVMITATCRRANSEASFGSRSTVIFRLGLARITVDCTEETRLAWKRCRSRSNVRAGGSDGETRRRVKHNSRLHNGRLLEHPAGKRYTVLGLAHNQVSQIARERGKYFGGGFTRRNHLT
jgi:hypothetical protein